MKKCIRKTLLIYVTLALILVGMAGVSYAITATDADSYVTRSKYSAAMSELQKKLDETESGLIGQINRYRTTDIKFVTYDTPDRMYDINTSNRRTGKHMGGNYFPRYRTYNAGSQMFSHYGSMMYERNDNRYATTYLNRLWNGDYFLTTDVNFKDSVSGDSATEYQGLFSCAVPVENLPGWYLILKYANEMSTYLNLYAALVKLDPNVPYFSSAAEHVEKVQNKELIIRFKKELWSPVSPTGAAQFTYTKQTYNNTRNFSGNNPYAIDPLGYIRDGSYSFSNTYPLKTVRWKDPETDDYMISFTGFPCCNPYQDTTYVFDLSNGMTDSMIPYLMPNDNVEYLNAPLSYRLVHPSSNGNSLIPDSRRIGFGNGADKYWEYEFVDCINGIKYWHAYRRGRNEALAAGETGYIMALGVHYSLPIVY